MATIMRNIGEIWRCANLFRMEEYEELGIGSYQDSYLVDICKHPGVTQEQLSKIMYLHKSNVARQVGSLDEKGFVERRPDPSDKRTLLLYPTEKAAAAMGRIREAHAAWRELLLQGFSEEERELAGKYLKRLAENAKRAEGRRGGAQK